jgi:hypothetical protein
MAGLIGCQSSTFKGVTMSAQLEFPPIIEQASSVAVAKQSPAELAKIDLTAVALAQFGDWKADQAEAKEKLAGLVLDLSTQSRIDEAKSLRHRTINQPIAEIRKVSKALKSKLASVSKAVGAEEESAVEGWGEVALLITPQIEAREAELAEERAEQERIEGERVAGHISELNLIKAFAANAKGSPAEHIAADIAELEGRTFGDECEDFLVEYQRAQSETLASMRQSLADAQAREAAEAQRLENERIAAELAAQRAALDAQANELKRQAAEVEAARLEAQAAEAKRIQAENDKAAAERTSLVNIEVQPPQQVLKAEPAMADATDRGEAVIASPSVGSMGAGQAADAAPSLVTTNNAARAAIAEAAPVAEPATLMLGEINVRLSPISLSAAALAELGIHHSATNKAATEVDPYILASALDHIARSARKSRSQTRRIRWIGHRAELALKGQEYRDIDIDLPKSAGPDTQEKMRRRLSYLLACIYRLSGALDEAIKNHPEVEAMRSTNDALSLVFIGLTNQSGGNPGAETCDGGAA